MNKISLNVSDKIHGERPEQRTVMGKWSLELEAVKTGRLGMEKAFRGSGIERFAIALLGSCLLLPI